MDKITIKQLTKGLFAVTLLAVVSISQAATTTRDLFLASTPGGLPLPLPVTNVTSSFIEFDDAAFLSGVAGSIVADSYYIDFVDGYGSAAPGEYIDQSFGNAIINHNGAGGILSLDLSVAIDATQFISVFVTPTSDIKTWSGHFEITQVPVPAAAWMFGSALMGLCGVRRLRK